MEEYDKLADVIEKNKANEDFEGSQAIVDRNLGPCLTCDKLIPVIKKNKFEDAKTDDDLRKSVIEGLERRGCTDNDVYEALLKIEIDKNPTALGFIRLAQGFVKKGNKAKAKEYYFKAVEIAETDEDKIAYLLECASAVPASAGECMGKIAKINPNSGAPILYKARKIGSSRCGTSAFEDAAINWAAYDMAAKAKSTDPSVAAEASRLMSAYKSRFPDSTQLFEQGLKVGQSYTTCNGYKTTVK
mgnify:FL=1